MKIDIILCDYDNRFKMGKYDINFLEKKIKEENGRLKSILKNRQELETFI
jgi:hypothetical protein